MTRLATFREAFDQAAADSRLRLIAAEVISVSASQVMVACELHERPATLAVLDYDPAPGDRVLVLGDESSGFFIMGVLQQVRRRPRLQVSTSDDAATTTVALPEGDLELLVPNGGIRIISAAGLQAAARGEISLESPVGVRLSILDRLSGLLRSFRLSRRAVEVRHEEVQVTAKQFHLTAREGRADLEESHLKTGFLSVAAQRISAEVATLTSQVGNLYQRVAGLWQLLAQRTRIVVDETSHHQARRIYSKAEDVKVKADQIHLG